MSSLKVTTKGTRGQKMARLLRDIERADDVKGYKVGWPSTAFYEDGTEVASVALWNEFGTVDEFGAEVVPERPFFRLANLTFLKGAVRIIKKAVNPDTKILDSEGNDKVGQYHANLVKREIRNLRDPLNAVSTILKKGSDNPLIDTGLMRRTVQHESLK